MNIHMTSIIPLVVGLALLAVGLTFSSLLLVWISAAILTYGLVSHTRNVAIIRRRNSPIRFTGYR